MSRCHIRPCSDFWYAWRSKKTPHSGTICNELSAIRSTVTMNTGHNGATDERRCHRPLIVLLPHAAASAPLALPYENDLT